MSESADSRRSSLFELPTQGSDPVGEAQSMSIKRSYTVVLEPALQARNGPMRAAFDNLTPAAL
jgi:hypothetical protein